MCGKEATNYTQWKLHVLSLSHQANGQSVTLCINSYINKIWFLGAYLYFIHVSALIIHNQLIVIYEILIFTFLYYYVKLKQINTHSCIYLIDLTLKTNSYKKKTENNSLFICVEQPTFVLSSINYNNTSIVFVNIYRWHISHISAVTSKHSTDSYITIYS